MSQLYDCKERPVPYPRSWAVSCPVCKGEIEYFPKEGDSGEIEMDPHEWPVCEECEAMFEPETVQITIAQTEPAAPVEDDA